jgi:GntR family transcriptional repressor for pyruvate dehydrogenase complex
VTTAPRTQHLERSRLSNRAADALKRSIVTGAYTAGAKLPTEKALAEELGVTRLTVREALSQLSAAGFIATRHGSGTYVVDLRERENLQLLAEMVGAGRKLTANESTSLMQFRCVVMRGFADAIMANATPEHVAALRGKLASARAETDPEQLAEIDYSVNELLSIASGNVFLTLLMRSLREVHRELGVVVYREHGDVGAILDTLDALADALERKQAQRFARVLTTYVDGAAAVVSEWTRRRPRKKTGGTTT